MCRVCRSPSGTQQTQARRLVQEYSCTKCTYPISTRRNAMRLAATHQKKIRRKNTHKEGTHTHVNTLNTERRVTSIDPSPSAPRSCPPSPRRSAAPCPSPHRSRRSRSPCPAGAAARPSRAGTARTSPACMPDPPCSQTPTACATASP